jgi:hypothetical protein
MREWIEVITADEFGNINVEAFRDIGQYIERHNQNARSTQAHWFSRAQLPNFKELPLDMTAEQVARNVDDMFGDTNVTMYRVTLADEGLPTYKQLW